MGDGDWEREWTSFSRKKPSQPSARQASGNLGQEPRTELALTLAAAPEARELFRKAQGSRRRQALEKGSRERN